MNGTGSNRPEHIQAFLFDVDKTLTNTKGVVTDRTQAALKKLVQKGYIIGVCTGRGYARVSNYILPMFPSENLHIVSGGSQVVTSKGEVKFSQALSSEQSQLLMKRAKELGIEFIFDSGNSTYASEKLARELQFRPYTDFMDGEIPNFVAYYLNDSFRQWVATQPFSVIEHESAILGTTLFDITAPGVGKATGVQAWAELVGVSPTEIIGFGDSYNDFSFLSSVGWSVALGNAVPELKEQAAEVIGHTDEDGLAKYLEQAWLR
jgi:Cof subfamily protein (haloacid dehalogenase superfamily)